MRLSAAITERVRYTGSRWRPRHHILGLAELSSLFIHELLFTSESRFLVRQRYMEGSERSN